MACAMNCKNRKGVVGTPARRVEIADIWQHIRGEKSTRIMQLYSEGLTPTEIAEEMNCTRGTVSSCITRTVQHLQSVFKSDIAI